MSIWENDIILILQNFLKILTCNYITIYSKSRLFISV
jgi:hypothetical protein